MARTGRRYPIKPHYNTLSDVLYIPAPTSPDVTATNIGDTYIRQDVPGDNQGTNTGLSLQWYQPFLATNHNLFGFTLPSTVRGTIYEIRLYLYHNGGASGGADADLYTTTSFTESTVTWTTAPAIGTNVDSINDGSNTEGWRYWVIRGAGATNSQNSVTWGSTVYYRMRFTTESGATKNFSWRSKEHATVNTRPYIAIYYTNTKGKRTQTNFALTRASSY